MVVLCCGSGVTVAGASLSPFAISTFLDVGGAMVAAVVVIEGVVDGYVGSPASSRHV